MSDEREARLAWQDAMHKLLPSLWAEREAALASILSALGAEGHSQDGPQDSDLHGNDTYVDLLDLPGQGLQGIAACFEACEDALERTQEASPKVQGGLASFEHRFKGWLASEALARQIECDDLRRSSAHCIRRRPPRRGRRRRY